MRWIAIFAVVVSCRSGSDRAASDVHALLLSEIDEFATAAQDLEDAAPNEPWSATSIDSMRRVWLHVNVAYERIEGPLSAIFPDLALSIDDRYEAQLRGRGNRSPFDGNNVRGIRAIERILWADAIPAHVTELERTLPGYNPARSPTRADELSDFKNKLCHQLVLDAQRLRAEWLGQKPDISFALDAIYWSIKEQRTELTKASTHEEESAYAQASMAVLRANLEGARAIYAKIRPLVLAKGGADADRDLGAAFDELARGLASGDTLPAPPPTWSTEHPTAADLESPFGKLHATVAHAFDSTQPTSAVSALAKIGKALGIDYRPPT